MALVDLIFNASQIAGFSSIGALTLDAVVSETISLASNATQYPVEEGLPVSDAILQQSPRLRLEGIITNADVSLIDNLIIGGAIGSGASKQQTCLDVLTSIYNEHVPIIITTGIAQYTDFAMTSCDMSRDNRERGTLSVRAEFVKIRKVALKEGDVPPEQAQPEAKGRAGPTKAPSTASPAQSKQSASQANPAQSASIGKSIKDYGASFFGK